MFIRKYLFLFLLVGLSNAYSQFEDYSDWQYSKDIVINTSVSGAYIAGNLVNYPLLLRFDNTNFDFLQAQADGTDIRFAASDGSHLAFEIERWNYAARQAEVWVKVNAIYGNSSTQYITMYWGNASASDESDSEIVFDNNDGFAGVWHLSEEGNTESDGYLDATSNNNDGTGYSMTTSSDVNAYIGIGQEFDGDNNYILINNALFKEILTSTEKMTVSFWVKTDNTDFASMIIWEGRSGANGFGSQEEYHLGYGESNTTYDGYLHFYAGDEDDNNNRGNPCIVSHETTDISNWHHVALTYDVSGNNEVSELFFDGVSVDRNNSGSIGGNFGLSWTTNTWIGRPGANLRYFNGILDELRISQNILNTEWIAFDKATQDPTTTPIVFGNTPPTLYNIESEVLAYTEGDKAVAITSSISISDVDDTNIESAEITISSNYLSTEDELSFTEIGNVSGSWNSSNGKLTLTGAATVADYQSVLRSIKYENHNLDNPSTATRNVSFVVSDGTSLSKTISREIEITEVVDPVIATLSGDTTVCSGEIAILNVELIGAGPWRISYTRNGTGEETIDIPANPAPYNYKLFVSEPGLYELTKVSNAEREGWIFGSADVNTYRLPTATISGDTAICEGYSFNIPVAITGTHPYSIIFQCNSQVPDTISDIYDKTYLLSAEMEGTYSLLQVSDKYCTNTGSGEVNIALKPVPEVNLTGLEESTYGTARTYPLSVSPLGGNFDESDFPQAIVNDGGIYTFFPLIAYTYFGSPFRVVYAWEDSSTHCVGRDIDTVFIVTKDVDIQVLNDTIGKQYCFNDAPFMINGINIRDSIGSFTIEGDIGLEDLGNNTAFIYPSLLQSGTRTVTYSVYFDGGWHYASKDFTFQKIDADFGWDNECFEEGEKLVNFYDRTDAVGAKLDSHIWSFYMPDSIILRSDKSTSLTFDEFGIYRIEYVVGSEKGCFDTIAKDLVLKPTINVFESPYTENFSSDMGNWIAFSENQGGVNSWKFGEPLEEPYSGAGAGASLWYTDILELVEEQSYVISPCFDFSGSERPMIKMDIWRELSVVDGAVLQYTLDNGENWFEVGALEDGINWFNGYDITGIPGGQGLGWTDKNDVNLVEARHKLDILNNEPMVRFRIAYGSPDGYGQIVRAGFAFDNIWIGERTKKVLIEHFTNAGDTFCRSTINEEFNSLINVNNEDIVDIQYHMGYPSADTFYYLNPGPSDAREYYYSLPDIPYGIIDGGRDGSHKYFLNYCEEEFEQIDLTLAALADNKFDLDVFTSAAGNLLIIEVGVKALEDMEEKSLTLQVAVVERIIKDVVGENGERRFESVLRDMVPNAQGTSYARSWTSGDNLYERFEWQYQDVFDAEELRVVVFIQDDNTKEIFQAEFDNPYSYSKTEEGAVDEIGNKTMIYPNPAYDRLSVRFKEPLRNTAMLQLLDNTGRTIAMKQLQGGELFTDLSLDGMDSGLYIVRLFDDNNVLSTQKLIVIGNK